MIVINKIYNEDCIKTISRIDYDSIDMIITSPPYNVDLGSNKYNKDPYDLYSDNKEHNKYIEWLRSILKNCYFILKPGGRICINIGDGSNGRVPTHADIINFMIREGYVPYSTIIWNKSQIGNRTAWGSFQSPSSPSFPTPFEYILVFCKESRKLQTNGDTDLTKKEFIDWSLALWDITPETNARKIGHPAPYPVELPLRLMKMLSWNNAIVYDPFIGSGSTAVACVRTGRRYIGSEISKGYVDIANKRIQEEYQRLEDEKRQICLF